MNKNLSFRPKFAVFGIGNLGPAIAGHLALCGYKVRLCTQTAHKVQPFEESNNYVSLNGALSGRVRLDLVTTDNEEAVADADIIILATTAHGHKNIVKTILPLLRPGQCIILHPSQVLGAIEVYQLLLNHQKYNIPVIEVSSSLFTCRSKGTHVDIFAIKNKVGFAALPRNKNDECFELIKSLYGEYQPQMHNNVMEVSMLNLNFVLHPIITIMNANRIECGKPFLFYTEGITPKIARIIESVDLERITVCNELGVKTFSLKDYTEINYAPNIKSTRNLYETLTTTMAYSDIYSPSELYTRYIWEDIPYGMMPLISIGQSAGVETPVSQAICSLCKTMFAQNWDNEARTLNNLGLGNMSGNELMKYINASESFSTDAKTIIGARV